MIRVDSLFSHSFWIILFYRCSYPHVSALESLLEAVMRVGPKELELIDEISKSISVFSF